MWLSIPFDTYLFRLYNYQRGLELTRVINKSCEGVKSGDCAVECPVDCIHPKKGEPDFDKVDRLFINPAECIDCGLCEAVCPVNAITTDDQASPEDISLNANFFKKQS